MNLAPSVYTLVGAKPKILLSSDAQSDNSMVKEGLKLSNKDRGQEDNSFYWNNPSSDLQRSGYVIDAENA